MPTKALVMLALLIPLCGQAQIIKCTKPDGSIELTDKLCATGTASPVYVAPINVVSGEYNRMLAIQQREQERVQYESEVRAANQNAAQIQANQAAKADREYQRQLTEAYAKAQNDAKRLARRQATANAAVGSCDAGGCWGSDGNRYNRSGSSGGHFRQDGKFCNLSGGFMLCN